ncbi:MAG: DUF2877 domain-containing protein [Ardenticatenaceae bacterium]|nr:DUF2877 domain-containing protein [Ardenticatenaceae bacterium]
MPCKPPFCSKKDDGCETAVTKLAGLGPGFTPAGDDFLLGFCLACGQRGQKNR